MKLVFYSVVLNHHQAPVADEFYRLLGDDYRFVELSGCIDRKGATTDYSRRPYLIRAWESTECYELAMQLARQAEVCVFGGWQALPFEKERMKLGLLSFDMSERLLKRGWMNLASPRILNIVAAYHLGGWRKKPIYKLACSAFTKYDCSQLGMFKEKCYKWGYFTSVEENSTEVHYIIDTYANHRSPVAIMWCSRFLIWKHPELAIEMADRLNREGYNFTLDIYGDDAAPAAHDQIFPMQRLREMIDGFNLNERVRLHGSRPNNEILEEMKRHSIFIFTSDKNEGWGAVANESMANGCVLVASDKIGSSPFLIENGHNGFMFENLSANSLTGKVKYLLDNPNIALAMRQNAAKTMREVWSPRNAAESLLRLIENLKNGRETDISIGPCSKA